MGYGTTRSFVSTKANPWPDRPPCILPDLVGRARGEVDTVGPRAADGLLPVIGQGDLAIRMNDSDFLEEGAFKFQNLY